MDFSAKFIFIVILQDFIGHFAPFALEFGVSHPFVFVTSYLSCDGQISRVLAHVTTLTAHEVATNVYKGSSSFISVKIEDTLSSFLVFLLELAERDALE